MGEGSKKLQIRKIVFSGCGTRDHFSLEQIQKMLEAETLKLEMPLQDILHEYLLSFLCILPGDW